MGLSTVTYLDTVTPRRLRVPVVADKGDADKDEPTRRRGFASRTESPRGESLFFLSPTGEKRRRYRVDRARLVCM